MENQLKYLLHKGYIKTSKFVWSAPVSFQKNKDSGLRLCVNYRGLNKSTIKKKCSLSIFDELVDPLNEAKKLSNFVLRIEYNQIRIKE